MLFELLSTKHSEKLNYTYIHDSKAKLYRFKVEQESKKCYYFSDLY
jgi:hypothetical protein